MNNVKIKFQGDHFEKFFLDLLGGFAHRVAGHQCNPAAPSTEIGLWGNGGVGCSQTDIGDL